MTKRGTPLEHEFMTVAEKKGVKLGRNQYDIKKILKEQIPPMGLSHFIFFENSR